MREEIIGIISEGAEDQGVLKCIFKAFGFDGSEIRRIRPDLAKDATDRHHNQQTIGTFQGVMNSCIGKDNIRPDFDRAFSILNCNCIVIQIDTAEIDQQNFHFVRPVKVGNPAYCTSLRESTISLINSWLNDMYQDRLLYAISIEEIESWCLTVFQSKNTESITNSKDKLQKCLSSSNMNFQKYRLDPIKNKMEYFEAFMKQKGFHKKNKLLQYSKFNTSLKDFITSIEDKFN